MRPITSQVLKKLFLHSNTIIFSSFLIPNPYQKPRSTTAMHIFTITKVSFMREKKVSA